MIVDSFFKKIKYEKNTSNIGKLIIVNIKPSYKIKNYFKNYKVYCNFY